MKKSLIALAVLAASSLSSAAFAADNSLYGFATAGTQTISKSVAGLDKSTTQMQVGLGAQVSSSIALEGSWVQGSHAIVGASNTVDISGFVMAVKGRYPVTAELDLTAKAGYSFLSADITGTDVSDSGVHPMVGLGAEYHINPKTSITFSYDMYKTPADLTTDMNSIAVGVKYAF